MSKQIIKNLLILAVVFSPVVAMAAETTDFETLVRKIVSALALVVPLLIAVGVVVFLYGVVKYITAGGDETKRKEGRDAIVYGIIGIFVMVSVWGLVWILLNTFDLEKGAPELPTFLYPAL